jgi:hypothetical protein
MEGKNASSLLLFPDICTGYHGEHEPLDVSKAAVLASEVADVLTNVQDLHIVLPFMHPDGSTVSALAGEHNIS